MSRGRAAAAVALVLMISCQRGKTGPERQPPPVILVFADVTDSLIEDEPEVVRKAIFDIFDRAPENSRILLDPIVPVMDYTDHLVDATRPFRSSSGVEALQRAADQRARLAHDGVAKLSAVGSKLQPRVPSSCLSGALRRAANDLPSSPRRPVAIIIISDMVEECDHSITGGKVMLNHSGIQTHIAAAMSLRGTYADLHNADVFFIYPASLPGSPRTGPVPIRRN